MQRGTTLAFWLTACVVALSSSTAFAGFTLCNWGQAGCLHGNVEAPWLLINVSPPNGLKDVTMTTGAYNCAQGFWQAGATGQLRASWLGQEAQYKLNSGTNSKVSAFVRGGAQCKVRATGQVFDNVDFSWKNVVNKQYRKSCLEWQGVDTIGAWGQLRTECYYLPPIIAN
jgi:hypothetical protein